MALLYYRPRTGVNLKSRNILILCCDIIPLANTNAPHMLHRSIIRLVLVGFNVAMELQKRHLRNKVDDLVNRTKAIIDMFGRIYEVAKEEGYPIDEIIENKERLREFLQM